MAIKQRNLIGTILYMARSIERLCGSYAHLSGISPSQARVLGFIAIATENQEIYQKDIEDEFAIRPSSATGLLQALEQQGLIHREAVSEDGRLKRIVLSSKGRGIQPKILALSHFLQKKLKGNLKERDLDVFMRLCGEITRHANQPDTEQNPLTGDLLRVPFPETFEK